MNAMEKVAWTELTVSLVVLAAVACLYPLLGDRATGAFGLLGFLVCSVFFMRRRGKTVIIDERDREIEQQATKIGVEAAWMSLFMALIVIVLWSSYSNKDSIALGVLNWLIWIQFVICYAVKGFVAVYAYRRQQHAT